ncbi:MAG: hypothetical protein WEF50_12525 [Myxococcota bacterium]
MTRSRVSGYARLASLGESRIAFVLASLPLLAPCFWQSRVQAGDLASHLYNAWLVQLIEAGRAPGLALAGQSTNVLFDWLLAALLRALGPGPAERIAAALAVLVFAWGAFAFVSALAGRRVWDLLPCIAMLAYGWVFHIGFFNFYLGLGLCLWALALAWQRPIALAVAPLLALAWLAHALPVAWAVGLLAFAWTWRRLAPRARPALLLGAIAALVSASVVVARSFPTRWGAAQWLLSSGADQLRVYDGKYDALAWALAAAWLLLLGQRIAREGALRVASRLELALFALCAAAVVSVPGTILLPGYGHALVYIAQRMSLAAAVLACALVAPARPGASSAAFAAIALVFFAFLYRDQRLLNEFEDRLDAVVAQLPEQQRVILGVRDPTLRVNALAHMIDRACVGRCYSYANYEASTRQFRVRIESPNGIVASTYAESSALQNGGHRVRGFELPLYQIVLAPHGGLVLESLSAGEPTGMTLVEVLPPLL